MLRKKIFWAFPIKTKDREEMLRAILNQIASQFYKYDVCACYLSNDDPKSSEVIGVTVIDFLINSKFELEHLINQLRRTPDILNVEVKAIYPGIAKYRNH